MSGTEAVATIVSFVAAVHRFRLGRAAEFAALPAVIWYEFTEQ
jgi:hypothetical protein